MIITTDFKYFKPKTSEEAILLLSEFEKNAIILAGGTDLIVNLKEENEKPEVLIDIKGIEELHEIRFVNNRLFIGANVTFSDLIDSKLIREKFNLLRQASKTVASIGIRNRATLIGNICSAVPSADSASALLVYEADVIVKKLIGERIIPITDWFIGPKKTALKNDEIVVGISIEHPNQKYIGTYEKLSRYEGEDLAQAGIGILAFEGLQFRVAFCAVGTVPKRSERIEELLNGNNISDDLIQKAKELIPSEISPISDIRSSKKYRSHMMQVMFERGMKKVSSQLSGGSNA
ncbi:MAG: xanthine dehydrogenase family protein subunit M [Candidatus Cloacimonetes bacterium]|nr:xanthine dehydrogenase family protein subunit M [Candidatus Cloacimonadota bacterium]